MDRDYKKRQQVTKEEIGEEDWNLQYASDSGDSVDDGDKDERVVTSETRCGFMLPSSAMEEESKRFAQVCRFSAGHPNPFITSRTFELGFSKDRCPTTGKHLGAFGKLAHEKYIDKIMNRKSLFFPERSVLRPTKTIKVERPTFEEITEALEMER